MRDLCATVAVLLLARVGLSQEAQGEAQFHPPPPWSDAPNVLIIVADDFGVDCIGAYAEHPDPPVTPNLDSLATEGVLFRNAWASAGCSPTRAMLLTGQQARRTGIGSAIAFVQPDEVELDPQAETLPRILADTHETAVIGKWHLANQYKSGSMHPLRIGFDTHRGTLDNILSGESYFHYTKFVDGQATPSTKYATIDAVDDTLEVIGGFEGPWFVVLNFNAPHAPIHAPPAGLHSYDLPPFSVEAVPLYARAMGEAMDHEIGRLLDGLPGDTLQDTLLFFIGDNGTMKGATMPPWNPNHGKGSPFEGGVNVPLLVVGQGVTPGECGHLVSATDLFATIAEITGAEYSHAEDSVSFADALIDPDGKPARQWVFAEAFRPNGAGPYQVRHRAARDARYKLISQDLEDPLDRIFFYDLWNDPFETTDLLGGPPLDHDQLASFEALAAVMTAHAKF